MKIVIVGGTGTIGKMVAAQLKEGNEVIIAGSKSGDVQVDMTDVASIRQLFEKTGKIDALVIAAGGGYIGPLSQTTEENFYQGIRSKLMGQINLTLIGQNYINLGGSVTLISGILAEEPIENGTVLSTINSAVNGFVIGAAGELFAKGIRINVVSPALVEDSVGALGKYFPGHTPAPMNKVVDAYIKSVKGLQTGQVYRVH